MECSTEGWKARATEEKRSREGTKERMVKWEMEGIKDGMQQGKMSDKDERKERGIN